MLSAGSEALPRALAEECAGGQRAPRRERSPHMLLRVRGASDALRLSPRINTTQHAKA